MKKNDAIILIILLLLGLAVITYFVLGRYVHQKATKAYTIWRETQAQNVSWVYPGASPPPLPPGALRQSGRGRQTGNANANAATNANNATGQTGNANANGSGGATAAATAGGGDGGNTAGNDQQQPRNTVTFVGSGVAGGP